MDRYKVLNAHSSQQFGNPWLRLWRRQDDKRNEEKREAFRQNGCEE